MENWEVMGMVMEWGDVAVDDIGDCGDEVEHGLDCDDVISTIHPSHTPVHTYTHISIHH
jgi:hypothetical protein